MFETPVNSSNSDAMQELLGQTEALHDPWYGKELQTKHRRPVDLSDENKQIYSDSVTAMVLWMLLRKWSKRLSSAPSLQWRGLENDKEVETRKSQKSQRPGNSQSSSQGIKIICLQSNARISPNRKTRELSIVSSLSKCSFNFSTSSAQLTVNEWPNCNLTSVLFLYPQICPHVRIVCCVWVKRNKLLKFTYTVTPNQ